MTLGNLSAVVGLGLLALAVPSLAHAADPTGGKFDGMYTGRKVQTSGRGCSSAGDVTIPVKEGVFMWGVKPTVSPITISPSGAIEGTSGVITIKGTASGTALDFDSTTSGCFNKWHLDKK